MKINIKHTIFLGFVLLLFSCKKEKPEVQIIEKVIDPTNQYWKEFEALGYYSNYMMDVVQFENKLFFISPDDMVVYDSSDLIALPTWTMNKNIKPPMNHGMAIFNWNDSNGIFAYYDYGPFNKFGGLIVQGNKFSNFKSFIPTIYNIEESINAVNDLYDKGFMLYYNKKERDTKDSIYINIGLFSKKLIQSTYDVADYKSIIIAMPRKPFSVNGVKAFFGKYYIATSESILQVDTAAQLSQVLTLSAAPADFLQTMFKFRDTLYAVSNYYIYSSFDKGNTWAVAYSNSSIVYRYKFKQLDNELFGYSFNEIIKVNITSEGFQITKLNNKGIGSRQITGIEKYKGKIYVTTLAGTYVKPYSELFKN
jgi:hypothetical protein